MRRRALFVLALSPVVLTATARAADPTKPAGPLPTISADTRGPQPETPARTPLPPGASGVPVPWERHLEIGGDVALAQKAATKDGAGAPALPRYEPAVGFGIHARWNLFKYLRFTAYFIDADHGIDLPPGSLGLNADLRIDSVETFSFGAKLQPSLPIGPRARAWASAGIGWGRLQFGRMQVQEAGHDPFEVRERADPFVEFPFGLGGSIDVVPRWLALEIELTAAVVSDESGEAVGDTQAIDWAGKKRTIHGFPALDGSFVQTIGLSLIL